jgi:hypothetical protein
MGSKNLITEFTPNDSYGYSTDRKIMSWNRVIDNDILHWYSYFLLQHFFLPVFDIFL